jgi:hypothetical protein
MDANMSRQIICSCENKRLLKSKSYRHLLNSYCMICLYVHVDGVRLCLWTAATNGPIVYPPHTHSVMILTEENWWTWRKTGPSATLSTTDPTWTDVGFRGERPATNHLAMAQPLMMTIIIIIMFVWWDVSELRPPTGLLFIPQAIYEHGEPWWNVVERQKLLTCSPEQSYQQRHVVASRRNGKRNEN